jgi:hypothetical protein
MFEKAEQYLVNSQSVMCIQAHLHSSAIEACARIFFATVAAGMPAACILFIAGALPDNCREPGIPLVGDCRHKHPALFEDASPVKIAADI